MPTQSPHLTLDRAGVISSRGVPASVYKYANKIDALTAILKRLDTGERLTAELLAEDFQVGVRTIYRYLSHLQAAGYPVY